MTANEFIDGYFGSRAEKLDSINLEELLANANPHLFFLNGVARADRIIEDMLQEKMHPFEEASLSQLQATLCIQDTVDSDTVFMQLLRDYTGSKRIVYNTTSARVSNRLCKEFCSRFLLPAGSIDWEKLVRFNSSS